MTSEPSRAKRTATERPIPELSLLAWLIRAGKEMRDALSACDQGLAALELARSGVFVGPAIALELGWLAGRLHLLLRARVVCQREIGVRLKI